MKKAAALGLLLLGCGSSAAETGGEVRVGLLLPYTGKDGSAGANYERGVLMAAERVNAAGGLHKRRLRIVYADTHSSLERGIEGAQALVDQGVVAIIGPEDDELARELAPVLAAADVALLTPSSSSIKSSEDKLWFRLAPSAKDLGNSLARRIKTDGVERIAVVSTTAVYERSFAGGASERLTDDDIAPQTSQIINARASNFSATIDAISATKPQAIVLAADASTGSRFVNEYAFTAGARGIQWYLSPSLEHQAFVLNSLPDVVESMIGVAPDLKSGTRRDAFDHAFLDRWNGVVPTTGAYFYYDALALFAIAYESAAQGTDGAEPPSDDVRLALLSASGQSGLVVEWDELSKGLKQASDGKGVYYSGVTGLIKLDQRTGTRSGVYSRLWTIRDGQIGLLQDEAEEQ